MSAENKTVAVRAAASVTLPAVSMRGIVIFPSLLMHFDVGREKSILAIKKAMEGIGRSSWWRRRTTPWRIPKKRISIG